MPTEPSPGGRPRIQIPATESEQQSPSHWPRSGQTSRVGYGRSPTPPRRWSPVAADHGVRATAIGADVTVTREVDAPVTGAVEFLGGLEIVVCNAGHLVGRQTVELMGTSTSTRWFR